MSEESRGGSEADCDDISEISEEAIELQRAVKSANDALLTRVMPRIQEAMGLNFKVRLQYRYGYDTGLGWPAFICASRRSLDY